MILNLVDRMTHDSVLTDWLSGLCDEIFLAFCVDAKLHFDDNAAYRQKDLFSMDNKDEIVCIHIAVNFFIFLKETI